MPTGFPVIDGFVDVIRAGNAYLNSPQSAVPTNNQPQLDGLERNKYVSTNLKYPLNVEELPHLIQFNIFAPYVGGQDDSLYKPVPATSGPIPHQVMRNGTNGTNITNMNLTAGAANPQLTSATKIESTIQMYMPETAVFTSEANWENTKTLDNFLSAGGDLTSGLGNLLGGAGGALTASAGRFGAAVGIGAALGQGLIKGVTGKYAQQMLYQNQGLVINPIIQVLYVGPELRDFEFTFFFAPTEQKEADNVKNIIKTFRAFMSPDYVVGNSYIGGLFRAPHTFDISFFRSSDKDRFQENDNIPRISRCILRAVNVDHGPDGVWVTGPDGYPVHTQLRLSFREMQIITQAMVESGGF